MAMSMDRRDEDLTSSAEDSAHCACGGTLLRGVVHRYHYQDEFGRDIEVHNVPAAVCRRCGDVVLTHDVLEEINARIGRQLFVPRHINLAQ